MRPLATVLVLTVFISVTGTAAADTGWTRFADPSSSIGAVSGDGVNTLTYVKGKRLVLVSAKTLDARTHSLPVDGCTPWAMAKDATTVVRCRDSDHLTALVHSDGRVTKLASYSDPEPVGPIDVFAFGDPWLLRYSGDPNGLAHVDYLNWRTGAVVASPFLEGDFAATDLDSPTPSAPSTCAPGQTLVRHGSRYLMTRRTHGKSGAIQKGGAVYLTTCGARPSSRRLGTFASIDHLVSPQLTSHFAVWTEASTAKLVRLSDGRTYKWRFHGVGPFVPVVVAVAGGRLIASVRHKDGRREIRTRRVPS